jgi:DNA repair protein RadA/Sms
MKPGPSHGCTECGYRSPKWLGRCPECGAWNSMVEEAAAPRKSRRGPVTPSRDPIPFDKIGSSSAPRLKTGISEFDRVLGGGVVPGSLVLVGGDPGIGKSTLLLQVAARLAGNLGPVLYVSGEESDGQIRMRADRLGVDPSNLLFLAETALEHILEAAPKAGASALIVDSIQTVYSEEHPSAPGSLAQVREAAARLLFLAKRTGIPVFVIGHVTKDSSIAGPRTLEHIVDTVLYFEGDAHHTYRLLRAVKNRFGPTNELGVFEMRSSGLAEVTDLTGVFVSRQRGAAPGSVVVPTIEGTRALLVEVQALVTRATYGTPERKVSGLDRNRVAMLLAVIEKRAGLALADHDVFVNAVGGVRIVEPAADLAVAVAIASSFVDKPISSELVAIGEVGLAGEVRGVPQMDARLREAAKLGATRALVPRESAKAIREKHKNLDITHAATLADALDAAFS